MEPLDAAMPEARYTLGLSYGMRQPVHLDALSHLDQGSVIYNGKDHPANMLGYLLECFSAGLSNDDWKVDFSN